jgi:hypothetical protein
MSSQVNLIGFRCLGILLTLTLSAQVACARGQIRESRMIASGGGSTGGGDAVVCRDSSGKTQSVEFYDLYEGREIDGITYEFGPANLDALGQVRVALARMARLNPTRAKKYMAQAEAFVTDTKWVSGKKLIDVPDTGIGFVPNHCNLEQVAIQDLQPFGDKRYLVNEDLYKAMGTKSQAALILHEILYREYGPGTSSVPVRKFNAFLWSHKAKAATLLEYYKQIWPLKFKELDAHNRLNCSFNRFQSDYSADVVFISENILKNCTTTYEQVPIQINFLGVKLDAKITGMVSFTDQGDISFEDTNNRYHYRARENLEVIKIYPNSADVNLGMGLVIPFSQLSLVVSEKNPLKISYRGKYDTRIENLNTPTTVAIIKDDKSGLYAEFKTLDSLSEQELRGSASVHYESNGIAGHPELKVNLSSTNLRLRSYPEWKPAYTYGQFQIELLDPEFGWLKLVGNGELNFNSNFVLTLDQPITAPVIIDQKTDIRFYVKKIKMSPWKKNSAGLTCREIRWESHIATQCQKTVNAGEVIVLREMRLYQLPKK